MKTEKLEALMVKAVDGLASPAEREALMAHLNEHPELRAEYEAQLGLKAITDDWVQRVKLDAVEDDFRAQPLSRLELGLGTALFVLGLALVSGFGAWQFVSDPEVPVWIRLGAGLMSAGTVVLLASAIRWRLTVSKSDRYTEVIR